MTDVKVKLLRPLDGQPEGGTATYSKADAERLESYGAVKILGKAEPAPENKMEAPVENKAEATTDRDIKIAPAARTTKPSRK